MSEFRDWQIAHASVKYKPLIKFLQFYHLKNHTYMELKTFKAKVLVQCFFKLTHATYVLVITIFLVNIVSSVILKNCNVLCLQDVYFGINQTSK